jgi:16S rRNA (adenine1518-N6/adenine1519-N6)-dimethyltransferase
LAQRVARLVAIELDDRLFAQLQVEFASYSNVELVHGDALKFDPCEHFRPKPELGTFSYKLLGNIPYSITSPLLRYYLETPCRAVLLVLMVQWDVAQRIVARPGAMSLLAISVQYYAEPSIVARVPASAFHPRPKVDSAILKLVPHSQPPILVPDVATFFKVVRAGFSGRRKQLANALASGLGITKAQAQALLNAAAIPAAARAQDLSLAQWSDLTRAYSTLLQHQNP